MAEALPGALTCPCCEGNSAQIIYTRRLQAELATKDEKIERLKEERDLAVAHDRQPYPTAEAYERVCEAQTKWQSRAEQAEQALPAELENPHLRRAHFEEFREAMLNEEAMDAAVRAIMEDTQKQSLEQLAIEAALDQAQELLEGEDGDS